MIDIDLVPKLLKRPQIKLNVLLSLLGQTYVHHLFFSEQPPSTDPVIECLMPNPICEITSGIVESHDSVRPAQN